MHLWEDIFAITVLYRKKNLEKRNDASYWNFLLNYNSRETDDIKTFTSMDAFNPVYLSLASLVMQSWEKWSLMSEMMLLYYWEFDQGLFKDIIN